MWSYWGIPDSCCQGEIINFSISVVKNRVKNNLKLQQVIIAESPVPWGSQQQDCDLELGKFIPLKCQRCVCAYSC